MLILRERWTTFLKKLKIFSVNAFSANILRKNDGAISIFLCLVMTANLLLAGIITEAVGMRCAETQISDAVDLASSSSLTRYEQILRDTFGLFALSEKNPKNLKNEFVEFFEKTLSDTADFKSLYDIRVESCNTIPFGNLTENPILKNQILQYMKYRAPKSLFEGFLDKIDCFSDLAGHSNILSAKTKLDKEMNSVSSLQQRLSDNMATIDKFNSSADAEFPKTDYIGANINKIASLICEIISHEKQKASLQNTADEDGGKSDKKLITQLNAKINAKKNEISITKSQSATNSRQYLENNKNCLASGKVLLTNSKKASQHIKKIKSQLQNDKSDLSQAMFNEICLKSEILEDDSLKFVLKKFEKNIEILDYIASGFETLSLDLHDFDMFVGDKEEIRRQVDEKYGLLAIRNALKKYAGLCNGNAIEYDKTRSSQKNEAVKDPRKGAENLSNDLLDDNKAGLTDFGQLRDEDLVSKTKNEFAKKLLKLESDFYQKDKKYFDYLINAGKIENPDPPYKLNSSEFLSDCGNMNEKAFINEELKNAVSGARLLANQIEFSEETKSGFSEKGFDFVSKITNLLKNGLKSVRDDIYINEYILGIFKNTLSDKKLKDEGYDKNLRGELKKSVKTRFKKSEVEYILTGNKNERINEFTVKVEILLVRFALNTLYIYLDAQKNGIAMETATTIAGWSGFGVPIVHALIMMAWAMAESVIDVTNILEGEKVALFKSKATWVLGEASLMRAFVGEIGKKTGKALELGVDKAVEVSKRMTERLSELAKSKIKIAVDSVFLQLEGRIAQKNETGPSNYMDSMESKIAVFAEKNFNIIKDSIKKKLSKMAEEEAAEYIYDIKTKMISKIYSQMDSILTELENKIDSVAAMSREKINEFIDKTFGKSGTSLKASDFKGSLLSMGYKDYLRLFLIAVDVDTKLNRIQDLIQLNIRTSTKNDKFHLNDFNSFFRVEATFSYRSLFLANKNANNSSKLNRHNYKIATYEGYY